ncbi:MAG TPA: hypothetical protein IAA17_03910 [Candidatus Lachnoclostridium stercorigallinarum]|uniref:Uncharacterized protein n=1 Tax=Candidatus Lachnoclostridium stercorigallinarum TaxID=2838634 RepID=A0A9D2GHZ2_9FIRM|nr:hypothetical protein [Candidatus Lachnoclostridium stercorigallinarum]
MNLIVYAVFGVVILLLLIQFIYIIKNASNNRGKKQNNKVYSKEISELGEKTMCAVKAGKVKKYLAMILMEMWKSKLRITMNMPLF